MSDELINKYNKEIKKYPVLSLEEQIALAENYIENNDINSLNKLVNSNLKYAFKIASKYFKRYKTIGLSLSDFVQASNIGLLNGLKKYNPKKKTKPINFAHSYIRIELDRLVGLNVNPLKKLNSSVDRFMIYRRQKILDIIRADDDEKESLRNKLSKETKLSVEDIREQEEIYGVHVYSLDDLVNNNSYNQFLIENFTQKDILNNIIHKDLENTLNTFLDKIDEKDAKWIKDLYFNQNNLSGIGKKNDITAERVRQIVNKNMRKVKHLLTQNNITFDDLITIE